MLFSMLLKRTMVHLVDIYMLDTHLIHCCIVKVNLLHIQIRTRALQNNIENLYHDAFDVFLYAIFSKASLKVE